MEAVDYTSFYKEFETMLKGKTVEEINRIILYIQENIIPKCVAR